MVQYEKRGTNTWRLTVSLELGADKKRIRERKIVTVENSILLKSPKKLDQYLNEEWYKFKVEVESGAYISPEKNEIL